MEIITKIFTKSDCYARQKFIQPEGIMVHSTGANNPYLRRYVPGDEVIGYNQYNNHWNMPGIDACVHGFIGLDLNKRIRTYQTLPWNMRGWHAGYGFKGREFSANNTHISFEICEDALSDENYFAGIFEEASDLCAFLCKEFNLSPDTVIDHATGNKLGIASNHGDVGHWFKRFGESIDSFREVVRLKLLPPIELDNVPSSWAKPSIDYMTSHKILAGDDKGNLKLRTPCTRQDMCAFLYRFYQDSKK